MRNCQQWKILFGVWETKTMSATITYKCPNCGGGLQYTESGIKDCSACLFPHRPENYDRICARFAELAALCRRPPEEEAGTPL